MISILNIFILNSMVGLNAQYIQYIKRIALLRLLNKKNGTKKLLTGHFCHRNQVLHLLEQDTKHPIDVNNVYNGTIVVWLLHKETLKFIFNIDIENVLSNLNLFD